MYDIYDLIDDFTTHCNATLTHIVIAGGFLVQ